MKNNPQKQANFDLAYSNFVSDLANDFQGVASMFCRIGRELGFVVGQDQAVRIMSYIDPILELEWTEKTIRKTIQAFLEQMTDKEAKIIKDSHE